MLILIICYMNLTTGWWQEHTWLLGKIAKKKRSDEIRWSLAKFLGFVTAVPGIWERGGEGGPVYSILMSMMKYSDQYCLYCHE